ncbi:MAG: dprA [Nocardioidaceae bacterium]|nr:dprA [Nocardioidaceae bacterium]
MCAALSVLDPVDLLSAIASRQTPAGVKAWPAVWLERIDRVSEAAVVAMRRADAASMRWICPGEAAWPERLNDLDHVDPISGATGTPLGLWVRGAGRLSRIVESAVSIVGARDATTYGCEVTSELAADVADMGITVVSGGAFGIDACAHRGALALGKPTVAVLAGGADVDYPKSHAALLERVFAEGLIISEQGPGQTPSKNRFLSRNRLIAALSQGTVVVEAARRSGSLNTLNWADQLGRVTMAVPGPVTSQASVGVHQAIRDGKAIIVTSGAEVAESVGVLGTFAASGQLVPPTAYDRLSPAQQRTLDAVDWTSPRRAEALADELRAPIAAVTRSLQELQNAGFVTSSPSGWLLVRRADLLAGGDRPTVTG